MLKLNLFSLCAVMLSLQAEAWRQPLILPEAAAIEGACYEAQRFEYGAFGISMLHTFKLLMRIKC